MWITLQARQASGALLLENTGVRFPAQVKRYDGNCPGRRVYNRADAVSGSRTSIYLGINAREVLFIRKLEGRACCHME